MNFSNKKVLRTFASPHTKNAWAYIEGIGWRKLGQLSTDGVTNLFVMLNAARGNNKTVSGTIDAGNKISILYL
jgi:immune inhibitor A